MPEQVASDGASLFGAVGSCARCACCGGFHAVYDGANVAPQAALDADDRGDFGSNGKTSFTTIEAAAQLSRANLFWGGSLGQAAAVSYAFRSTAPSSPPSDTNGFARFSEAQIAVTLQGLSAWSDVANITFQRVSDADGYSNSATMLFANYTSGASGSAAFAYLPGSTSAASSAGDVWVNSSLTYNANPVTLGYGAQVLTHEIGHAIGLSHPAAYNAAEGVSITYTADAVYYEDSRQYTIMSYFSETNTGGNFTSASGVRQYSAAPLLDDIAAIQRIYGANATTRVGDTVYGFNSTADRSWYSATSAAADVIFAVWDAGGNDTLDFSGYTESQLINLRQGAFSSVGGLVGNVAIAIGSVIENAIGGSGADRLYGNSADNRLTGGAGNDTLDGGLGNDIAIFSGVRSAYTITYSGNTATIAGPDGVDVLTNVETFQFADGAVASQALAGGLMLSGDTTNDLIQGGAFSDTLSGLGGNDTLNGSGGDDSLSGGTGDDVLNGGEGQDQLTGGSGNDTIDGGDGVDSVQLQGVAGVGVTLNLATGVSTGGDGVDTIRNVENVTGSSYADVITGSAADNRIAGGGGSDTVFAGAGNDIVVLGAASQGGGAPDVVKAQTTANGSIAAALNIDGGFDLLPRDDVVNSGLVPHATVVSRTHGGIEYYAFTVTANVSATFDIDGAGFDSTLRVLNGAGVELASNDDNDSDNGGERTDSQVTYTFTTAGTYYIEVAEWTAGAGSTLTTKAPVAGLAYTLHVSIPGHSVVPLTAIGSYVDGQTGNDRLEGGAGPDTVLGGEGADTIFGGGGNDGLLQGNQGNDVVSGQDGDDFVFGGQGDDSLYGGVGADFVQGNIGADLVFGDDGNDSLFGGQNNDTVSGGAGADLIFGDLGSDRLAGDAGNDTLQGGAGSDVLAGGDGIDVASYTKPVELHYFEASTGGGWRIYDGLTDIDTLSAMERGQFGSRPVEDLSVLAQSSFDAYGYMLGYADLLTAFRNNPLGAYLHYVGSGQAEGRVADSFNGLTYIASYRDLITTFGASGNLGSQHFALSGQSEGRVTTFDAANYLAVNADVRAAFGNDLDAAARHYIQYGFFEGRATGGAPLQAADDKQFVYEAYHDPAESAVGAAPESGQIIDAAPIEPMTAHLDLVGWMTLDAPTESQEAGLLSASLAIRQHAYWTLDDAEIAVADSAFLNLAKPDDTSGFTIA